MLQDIVIRKKLALGGAVIEHIMTQFVLSFNSVAPFFLIMFFGWLAVRLGLVGDPFLAGLNKLAFTYFFPATLFLSIYQADLSYAFDPALVGYFVVISVSGYLLSWAIGARFLNKQQLGVFVQAANRSNYVVLAMAIIVFLLGDYALPKTALMVPFVVTVNNVMTTLVFTVTGMDGGISGIARVKGVVWGILKLPMVLAVLLGLLANVMGLSLPVTLDRSISSIANMAAPAVLLCVGGVLRVEKVRRHFKLAAVSMVIKNMILPIGFIVPAVLLGFRGVELAILSMVALSPTGSMTYAVAAEMGGDRDLAASCLVFSNGLAIFTIVPALTVLRVLGLF